MNETTLRGGQNGKEWSLDPEEYQHVNVGQKNSFKENSVSVAGEGVEKLEKCGNRKAKRRNS